MAQVTQLQAERIGGVADVRRLYRVATAEQHRALFSAPAAAPVMALGSRGRTTLLLSVVRYREGHLVPHGALAQQYLANGLTPMSQR